MSNYNSLKTTIDANIKQNGQQEITGQILNSVLNQMVTTLGAGYQFAGVATIDTKPGTPDAKVFYIANGKGLYKNFGGINIDEDEVVLLVFEDAWNKVLTGIASNSKLTALLNDIERLNNAKQDKTSENLITDAKDIVDAINETFEALKTGRTTDNRVLAEALVSLEARISALEGGKPYLGNATAGVIDVKEITRARYPLVMVAHGVPAEANVPDNLPDGLPWDGIPAFIGQLYINIDATSGGLYYATGHDSVSNWRQA